MKMIKKPSFSKCARTSKNREKPYYEKKQKQKGIGNGDTDAVNESRIQGKRNNVFLGVRSHDGSPFCPKKYPATKRQDNCAANRLYYDFDFKLYHKAHILSIARSF